jgi:hypothetical protein
MARGMTTALILGPSRWDREDHSEVPSWLVRRSFGDTSSPLGVRRGVATFLRDQGMNAVVMEDWPEKIRERNSVRFFRVIREAGVSAFLVYWPRGSRLHGITWELSKLESRIRTGHLDRRRVRLLVEEGVASLDVATGEGEFVEEGNRTAYYQDLLDLRCPIHVWADYDQLQFTLRQLAGALQN